jgi:hypothetical protein
MEAEYVLSRKRRTSYIILRANARHGDWAVLLRFIEGSERRQWTTLQT